MSRTAACSCGQLTVTVEGEPDYVAASQLPRMPEGHRQCLRRLHLLAEIGAGLDCRQEHLLAPQLLEGPLDRQLFLPGLRQHGLLVCGGHA